MKFEKVEPVNSDCCLYWGGIGGGRSSEMNINERRKWQEWRKTIGMQMMLKKQKHKRGKKINRNKAKLKCVSTVICAPPCSIEYR
jgi:hypothetical protein